MKFKFSINLKNEPFPILGPFWKKNYPLIITILLLITLWFTAYTYITYKIGDWIQIGIGLAIFWYSLETMLVRKSMVFQNELEQRPIVDIYLRNEKPRDNPKKTLAIRNIGRGAAYNIDIENIYINNYKYKFYLDETNQILAPDGDEKPLSIITETTKINGMVMHTINSFLNEIEYSNYVFFLIKYSNIQGEQFYSVFKLYNQIPKSEQPIIDFVKSDQGIISNINVKRLCDKKPLRISKFSTEV